MADIINIGEAREYLARLKDEQIAALERRAAGGFVEARGGFDRLREATLKLEMQGAAYRLDDLEKRGLSRLEELELAETLARLRREHPAPGDSKWASFLEEHPELGDESTAATVEAPSPLVFTDDELVFATARAIQQWQTFREKMKQQHSSADDGVTASDIAVTLRGRKAVLDDAPAGLHGDSVRVGQALNRLERAGRVFETTPRYQRPRRWAPTPGGVIADAS